jgi:hypothetical protein
MDLSGIGSCEGVLHLVCIRSAPGSVFHRLPVSSQIACHVPVPLLSGPCSSRLPLSSPLYQTAPSRPQGHLCSLPPISTPLCSIRCTTLIPQEYVPTVFENLITTLPSPLDPSKLIELALWDTAGQEDFDRLRPLSYNETDVILVVFACNHRPSLMNVQDKVCCWHCCKGWVLRCRAS